MLKRLSVILFLILISIQVEANFNFALHTDSHPWAREDAKGAQKEIDNLIKILSGVNLEVFDPKDIDGLGQGTYGWWWQYLDPDRYHPVNDLSD